jgi:hypothetical protein
LFPQFSCFDNSKFKINLIIMNDKKSETAEVIKDKKTASKLPKKKKEIGGADGPEPTRFGDWEKKGITSDF